MVTVSRSGATPVHGGKEPPAHPPVLELLAENGGAGVLKAAGSTAVVSQSALDFVRHHPGQAARLIGAALERAAGVASNGSVPEALAPYVVEDGDAEILGVTEAAERLRVSRQTVYDWIGRGILLAWRGTGRGYFVPAEQIRGARKVVPGLPEIARIIDDPESAWSFLSQDWPFDAADVPEGDHQARPIDLLANGQIETVLNAARGYGSTFS